MKCSESLHGMASPRYVGMKCTNESMSLRIRKMLKILVIGSMLGLGVAIGMVGPPIGRTAH